MQINWVLLVTYVLIILVEVVLPVGLGVWLLRKYKSLWVLLVTGIAAYALAELIHIPALNGIQTLFNNGTLPMPPTKWLPLVNGLIVGALTGILENITRWIGFKINGKNSKPFRSAIALGIGHGGIQLLMVGILLAINLCTVLFYNAGAQIAKGVSTASVQSYLTQIQSYWASPWYYGALNLFEHLATFVSQFVITVMVWRAVSKHRPLWLLWAVLYQTVNEGITTFLSGMNWGLWEIEGVIALFLLLNVLLMYFFWNDEGGLESENDEDDDDEDDEDEEDDDEESDDEESDDEAEPKDEASPEEDAAA
jgi:uncharacterized membrane protein YhfC